MNIIKTFLSLSLIVGGTLPAMAHTESGIATHQHITSHLLEAGVIGLALVAVLVGLGLLSSKR